MDSGFNSGLKLIGVSGMDCCCVGFCAIASAGSAGMEYKLDWFLLTLPPPKNRFSSSFSSDEIMETWDNDLDMLFFRLGWLLSCCCWVDSSAIVVMIFCVLAVSLIVGWIFSSIVSVCGLCFGSGDLLEFDIFHQKN